MTKKNWREKKTQITTISFLVLLISDFNFTTIRHLLLKFKILIIFEKDVEDLKERLEEQRDEIKVKTQYIF